MKVKWLIIILVLWILMIHLEVNAKDKFSLELIWEIGAPSTSAPVGDYSKPVVCNGLLYIEEHGAVIHDFKVHDLKTGKLVDKIKKPAIFNEIGPVTNGTELVYANEETNSLTKYIGLTPQWEIKFEKRIDGVIMDEKRIYVLVPDELIFVNFNGKISDSVKDESLGYIVFQDSKSLYLQGKYLSKVDKATRRILYRKPFEDYSSYEIIGQNERYLFGDEGELFSKDTGELVGLIEEDLFSLMYFEVNDDYIVYCTHGKLKVKNADNLETIWEKQTYYYSFTPVIVEDRLYIFLDQFMVIDIKTGETIWKDEIRDQFIDYVPQIIVSGQYVIVYVEKGENSLIRVYS